MHLHWRSRRGAACRCSCCCIVGGIRGRAGSALALADGQISHVLQAQQQHVRDRRGDDGKLICEFSL